MLQATGVPGITVKDPVHYCIHWDLRSANNKTLEWTARAPGKPVQTVRRWTPENEELNKYWDVPLRAIFTFWSNRHIVEWSGECGAARGVESLYVFMAYAGAAGSAQVCMHEANPGGTGAAGIYAGIGDRQWCPYLFPCHGLCKCQHSPESFLSSLL